MRVKYLLAMTVLLAHNLSFAQSSWISQTSGLSTDLNDVAFSDGNNGTAVGSNGKIIRTINGGTNWLLQASGTTSATLYGVSFTDSSTGTAVGGSGTILRTTNAGATWIAQTGGLNKTLQGVSFVNSTTGTVVGNGGFIIRTTNAGTTWTPQPAGTATDLYNVDFTDVNNGTAVGANGTILRTTNGGTTWTAQTSGTTATLRGVSFVDSTTGTAVGYIPWQGTGVILRTTNGGATWIIQYTASVTDLYGVDLLDANNGIVVGAWGAILSTTNGGASWATETSGVSTALYGVAYPTANSATAVGMAGTILHSSGISSCPLPIGVNISGITTTGATATWTPPAGITTFEYSVDQVSLSPAMPGTPLIGNSVAVTSLAPGTIYYLHVRSACSGGSFSSWVNVSFTTAGGPTCPSPLNVAISAIGPTSANASWTIPGGISNFEYIVDQSAGSPASSGTAIIASSYTISSLSPGTSYYFHIRSACSGNSFSTWVNVPFTTTISAGCSAPSNVTFSSINSNSAVASWTGPSGVTNYQYILNQSASSPTTSGTATTGTSLPLSALSPATTYYLHVRSACSASSYSNWVNTSFTTSTICTAPTAITISAITASSVTLSWAAIPGTTGYEYAVTTSATPPSSGAILATPSVTKTGLTSGTSYFAHVRTKCGNTVSTWTTKAFSTSTTAIDDVRGGNSIISISPNPTTTTVSIRIDDLRVGRIRITDLYGRIIKELAVMGELTIIDLSNVVSGAYFVNFTNGHISQTVKLQKL